MHQKCHKDNSVAVFVATEVGGSAAFLILAETLCFVCKVAFTKTEYCQKVNTASVT